MDTAGDGLDLVSVRLATDEDNRELLDLERMCPQGTSLVLLFDRSPDFFRRSRVYENSKVYVAEEGGKIVGTVGAAIKEFIFGKKQARGVYIYDLRVDPGCRGRGIGARLIQHAVGDVENADFAYGIIAEDNDPSRALFTKMGFQSIREFVLFNIPLYNRQEQMTHMTRTMTTNDLPSVVELVNNYYENRDFFSLLNTTDFLDKIKRLPGYGVEKIHVVEDGNQIVACAGLWDYSEIFRICALHVSAKLRIMTYLLKFISIFKSTMKLPSVGEPFRLMYVRDFAFTRETASAEELIKHSLSLACGHGCNFLSFALDSNDPAIPLLAKYKPIKVTYHVYAKSLRDEALSKPTSIYVDPADL